LRDLQAFGAQLSARACRRWIRGNAEGTRALRIFEAPLLIGC
jgi:hypothetical protein